MNIENPQIIQSIDAGILQGRSRFVSAIPNFDPDANDTKYRDFILGRVRAIQEDWNPRAVQILSELIIIGMYSREYYGESDLTVNEVDDFVTVLAIIFNSWLHT